MGMTPGHRLRVIFWPNQLIYAAGMIVMIYVIFVPNYKLPPSHPMPVMAKASYDAKASYRESISAVGILGATVKKVDNGMGPRSVMEISQ
jgi:hypothetical protein